MPVAQTPILLPGQVYLKPGWTIEGSIEGVARLRATFVGLNASLLRGVFTVVSSPAVIAAGLRPAAYTLSVGARAPCPIAPSLGLYGLKIISGNSGLGAIETEWRGLTPNLQTVPPPVYELQRSTGNEPLSTHPKWSTHIAGVPDTPLNGAIFIDGAGRLNPAPSSPPPGYPSGNFDSATATFKEFAANLSSGDPNPWVGRDDYLVANTVFLKTYTSFSPPNDMGNVGKFSNPDGPAPSPPTGYAWFYLGETSTDEVGIYRIQASWRLVPTDAAAQLIYS